MIQYGIQKTLNQHRICNQPPVTGFLWVFVAFSLVCGLVFVTPAAADSGSTTDNNASLSVLVDPILQDQLFKGLEESIDEIVEVDLAKVDNNQLLQGLEESINEIAEVNLAKADNNQLFQGIEESISDVGSLVNELVGGTSGAVNELVADLGSTSEPVAAERSTASIPTQNASGAGSLEAPQPEPEAPANVVSNTVSRNTVNSNTVSVIGQKQLVAANHQGTGSSESEEKHLVPLLTTGILTAGAGSANNSGGSSPVGVTVDLTKLAQLTPIGFIADFPDPHGLSPFIGLLSPPG